MSTDNKDNFHTIYTTYYRKSFLFVKSYVHDSSVAEDIVSETLIKIWEKMKQESIDCVQVYLLKMLKNKALDFLKHQAIEQKAYKALQENHHRELEIRISVLEACDPEEIFSSEIQQIIQTTLDQLPQQSRRIFIMSRFENKNHKEIAELLKMTVKGVDYHIALSTKALKFSLKDYLLSSLIFIYFC